MIKIILLSCIVTLNCSDFFSQVPTTINGLVLDFSNDSIIRSCKITLIKNKKSCLTDSTGHFWCRLKCDCFDTLIIEKEGYCTLLINDIDPSQVFSRNDLILYLCRETTSTVIFHEVLKKKLLGIPIKRIYMTEIQKPSTCCTPKDTSYYKGWVSYKTDDSLHESKIKCVYITTLKEILKMTRFHNDRQRGRYVFDPKEENVKPLFIDSTSSCYVFKEKEIALYWARESGQFKNVYAQYLKNEIKKLQIKYDTVIKIQFVLEYDDRYNNIKISGINESDKEKIMGIIRKGPHWPPQHMDERARIRLEKNFSIEMND